MYGIAGIYRTFNPKMPRYEPDGKGRDYFITQNNGGMLQDKVSNRQESTLFQSPSPKHSRSPPGARYVW